MRGPPRYEPARLHGGRAVSTLGLLLVFVNPVLALLEVVPPISALDQPPIQAIGISLVLAGITGTLVSQAAMGASWRPDVDRTSRTELVTDGPFRLVRNPVLSCTFLTAVGLALMAPSVVAVLMLAAIASGLQIQVRLVEEPFLVAEHGEAYRRYARRTGRFIPGLG